MELLLAILLLLSQSVSGVRPGQQAEGGGGVWIEQKRAVLKRGEDAPEHKKEVIVIYPAVGGLKDRAVLLRVQTAVSLKEIFGRSLDELQAEIKEETWLSEIRYKVNYNRRSILDITFTQSGVGAYPSEMTEHRVINLKTGNLLKAADVFNRSSLNALVGWVNQAMQAEVRRTIRKSSEQDWEIFAGKSARFRREHLDQFSVSDKGVTFFYDFGFPHVAKALEPPGRYFFSYEKLKASIKREGLLGPFVQ